MERGAGSRKANQEGSVSPASSIILQTTPALPFADVNSPSRSFLQLASWTFVQTDLQMGFCYRSMVFQRYLETPEFSWKHGLNLRWDLDYNGIG